MSSASLDYILNRFGFELAYKQQSPVEIPNVDRGDLAKLLHELDFKTAVEVGVADGEYSEMLMLANPQMKLYGVDPYVPYDGFNDYVLPSTFNQMKNEAHKRLDAYSNYEFIEKTSKEAAQEFSDGSLDFVYLDANHSEPYISEDINMWTPKVRKGGIIAGHDYMRIKGRVGIDGNYVPSSNWAAVGAVNRYCSEHKLQFYIWGLSERLHGFKRENSRSWMFIAQ